MNKILYNEPVKTDDDCPFCNQRTVHLIHLSSYLAKEHKVVIVYACVWCMNNLDDPQVRVFTIPAQDWVKMVKDSNYSDEN